MKKKLFSRATIVVTTILLFSSCAHKLTTDEAINAVISAEQDRIPLLIQEMSDVESITIDSMRIRIKDEPMNGYLYTKWKYIAKYSKYPTMDEMIRGNFSPTEIEEEREKQVIVSVDNIHQSKERKDYIEWETDWSSAYGVVLHDQFSR